jgi:pantoate--beta-alanine ligase
MGALHAGHLDLVRRSLRENRHTVVSIFVNPAQFAPTEDLASYPRTLESDIASLVGLEKEVELAFSQSSRSTAQGSDLSAKAGRISAIFCPDVREMYPPLPGTQTPFTQNVSQQQGAFIEVQGLSSVLEGKSRPGFFRGVATVVTKLWHIVEVSRLFWPDSWLQLCTSDL